MKAAWYEKQGPAREVLTVGDMPDPAPGPGELRIRIATSGINPGDIRKRQDDFGYGSRILASSPTAMAQGKWTRLATVSHRSGWESQCGATARSPIARLALPLNLQSFRQHKPFFYPRT